MESATPFRGGSYIATNPAKTRGADFSFSVWSMALLDEGVDGREGKIPSALEYAIAITRNPRVATACALAAIPERTLGSRGGVDPSATW